MKRKIFSILFALVLVLSLGLVTAVPSQVAAQGSEGVTLVATHAGIAEWSIAQQHIGDYSIHLVAPGKTDWGNWGGTYADALIQIPLEGTSLEGLTLNDIVSMSWWNYLVSGYPPALRIKLDADGDGDDDYHLVGEFAYQEWDTSGFAYTGTPWVPYTHYKPGLEATNDFYYPTYDTWMPTFQTTDDASGDPAGARTADTVATQTVGGDTIFWVMVVGGGYNVDWCSAPYANLTSYFATLEDYQTGTVTRLDGGAVLPVLGDAEVLMLEFAITNEIGLTGAPAGHEVYFDDLTINGAPYALELPAERPLTVDDDREQNPDAYFQTIQGAIDCATSTTILVADGTYTEDLVVNIADLTLRSETGKANTTIQLVDGVGIDIQGGADNFTLGGAVDQGFTVLSSGATSTTFNIQLTNAPSSVEISYNTINTTGSATQGISVGAAGATDLTIIYNDFIAEVGDGSIWGPNVVDVTVSSNTFNGPSSGSSGYAVQFSGVTGTSTISNNPIISGYTGSGAIVISNGAGTSGLTISGNTIDECSNGIYFVEYCAQGTAADMTTVTVTQNTITDSTNDGIKVGNGAYVKADEFVIRSNNFLENTFGLENLNALEVTAECNYWGSASGPYNATTNPGGTGNEVSVNVDYHPWLLVAGGSCVDFDQAQILQVGWTLVSIDNWVDTAETRWDGVTLALKYTAGIGYEDAFPVDLEPVSALYLKTEGGGGLGITYSGGVPVASSKDLEPGWNLISSATETNARAVLSPLRYIDVGEEQGVGLATLVSQGSYNRNTGDFYLPTMVSIDWLALGSEMLSPFDGYWVYMNAGKNFGVIPQ